MKLTKLEIRRTESYATPPSALVGLVELTGDTGQQQIVLTATSISELIGVIAKQVAMTARVNAKQVEGVLADAQAEVYLLEADGDLSLPSAKKADDDLPF